MCSITAAWAIREFYWGNRFEREAGQQVWLGFVSTHAFLKRALAAPASGKVFVPAENDNGILLLESMKQCSGMMWPSRRLSLRGI
jgi:hypothetical protein